MHTSGVPVSGRVPFVKRLGCSEEVSRHWPDLLRYNGYEKLILLGAGIPTPLKNISSSVRCIVPDIWKT